MANSLPTQEKGQRSSKNAFYQNGTSTILTQTVKGITYRSTKSMAKNKVSWTVAQKNGAGKFVDMEFATPSKAEAFALGLCALSNEEVFSTVYLDSRKPFVMVTGTPTERFNYISNLFRLEDYDRVRQMALDDLAAVNKQEVELTALRETYEGTVVNPADLRKWRKLHTRKLAEATAARAEADTLRSHVDAIKVYLKYKDDIELLDVDLKALKRQWASHTKQKRAYEDYQSVMAEGKTAKRSLEKLERKEGEFLIRLKELCTRVSVPFSLKDDPQEFMNALVKVLDTAHNLMCDQEELVGTLDDERLRMEAGYLKVQDADKALRIAKRKLKGKPTQKEVYGEQRVTEHRIVELRKHLDAHNDGKCTTCGHSYPARKAKKDLRVLEDRLAELDLLARQHDKYEKASKERDKLYEGTAKQLDSELDKLVESLVVAQSVLNKMKDELAASGWESFAVAADTVNADWQDDWEDIAKDKSALTKQARAARKATKVEKPSTDRKLKDTMIRADKVQDHADLIRSGASIAQEYEVSGKPISSILRSLERGVKLAENKVASASVNAGKYETKVMEGQRTIRQLAKVKHRIRELRENVKFKRSYEAVADAYGKNGVKMSHVDILCQRISSNLNKYSHLLFPEKFEFQIVVAPNTFDVLVKRPTGEGPAKVSDALHLSGSEGRSFQLLWLISVLPFLPAERRYNVAILDEMEATMDEPSRELMIRDFLPVLNKIIPHIVFISPNSDNTPGHNYRHLEVVKKGKTSTVHLINEVA
ncbi:SbcC-like subunit of palindrome specific endonuclease [Pseudomonas phage vB_PpuM-Voja-6]